MLGTVSVFLAFWRFDNSVFVVFGCSFAFLFHDFLAEKHAVL